MLLSACLALQPGCTSTADVDEGYGFNITSELDCRNCDPVTLLIFVTDSAEGEDFLHDHLSKGDEVPPGPGLNITRVSVELVEGRPMERRIPTSHFPRTAFLKLVEPDRRSAFRYKTVRGNRFRSDIIVRDDMIVVEQTPF